MFYHCFTTIVSPLIVSLCITIISPFFLPVNFTTIVPCFPLPPPFGPVTNEPQPCMRVALGGVATAFGAGTGAKRTAGEEIPGKTWPKTPKWLFSQGNPHKFQWNLGIPGIFRGLSDELWWLGCWILMVFLMVLMVKRCLGRKKVWTWKTAVAVNFHRLETAKTSNPVAQKDGTLVHYVFRERCFLNGFCRIWEGEWVMEILGEFHGGISMEKTPLFKNGTSANVTLTHVF